MTAQGDSPSSATSKPSKEQKPPTGLIPLRKPLQTTCGRPSSWSPREEPAGSLTSPTPPTQSQSKNTLLDHFCPPEDALPSRGRLKKNRSATPLTEEEIKLALSKSSPSAAPGPDGIPYSVWKQVNLINPTTLLELLSPLVAFRYHPPSLKTANGVVLDKRGKAS